MEASLNAICVFIDGGKKPPAITEKGIIAEGANALIFDSAKWDSSTIDVWAKNKSISIVKSVIVSKKSLGDMQHPARKTIVLEGFKAVQENGALIIEGYANTKGHPDRYGDVPTVFPALRSFVYDLGDYLENPVLMLNHDNNTSAVAGHMLDVHEDEKGLYFKGQFSNSDFPPVAHARTIYAEGHAKALSIAGSFFYENPDKPEQLTLAKIYEISLVGVGADPHALCNPVKPLEPPRAAEAPEQKGTSELLGDIRATTLLENLKAATAAIKRHAPPEAGKGE